MIILPHHVAGVFLATGLATGGYFAVKAVTPYSLEEKLKLLNVKLLGDIGWDEKAKKYKELKNNNLITSIVTEGKKDQEVGQALKNWCQKKKNKSFLDNTDQTYKNFSLWCTVSAKIKDVLEGRQYLNKLDDVGWNKKVEAYNAPTNSNKFVESSKATDIDKVKLETWCTEKQRDTEYNFEGDDVISKILNWCYA